MYESRHEKPAFCICENKDADQLRSKCAADQRLCFATWIVQSLYFIYTKFQASSHLVWLCSLVYVGPGRKPRRPVFSQRGSYTSLWTANTLSETVIPCFSEVFYKCCEKPPFFRLLPLTNVKILIKALFRKCSRAESNLSYLVQY